MPKAWVSKALVRLLIGVAAVAVLAVVWISNSFAVPQFVAFIVGLLLVLRAFEYVPLKRLSSLQRHLVFDMVLAVYLSGLVLLHQCPLGVAVTIVLVSLAATLGDAHDKIAKARAARISRREALARNW